MVWGPKKMVYILKCLVCCLCTTPNQVVKKLNSKGERCIYASYFEVTKGYKLCNLLSGKLIVSRDVVFEVGAHI